MEEVDMRNKTGHYLKLLYSTLLIVLWNSSAFALAPGYRDDQYTPKDHVYYLITGGFGSFVIVFMGLGGLASLMMTRQGQKGRNVPILGVAMLSIAAILFAMKVAIRSGICNTTWC